MPEICIRNCRVHPMVIISQESFNIETTMIRKQCEKKIKCHGREEHRDNIHHWAENLLEFA